MSARGLLVAGVAARLREVLTACAVFDAPPVRSGLPHAVVDEPVLADWSGTTWNGREGRVQVTLVDAGERPVRLRALLAEVEDKLPTMSGTLGEGWKLLVLTLVRSRMQRTGERWTATAEFRVRLFRLNG